MITKLCKIHFEKRRKRKPKRSAKPSKSPLKIVSKWRFDKQRRQKRDFPLFFWRIGCQGRPKGIKRDARNAPDGPKGPLYPPKKALKKCFFPRAGKKTRHHGGLLGPEAPRPPILPENWPKSDPLEHKYEAKPLKNPTGIHKTTWPT